MLYAKYTDQPVEPFEGVTVDELHKVETMFEVNIIVCKRSVRRSLYKYANTMYINLHETHFSLIHDIDPLERSQMIVNMSESSAVWDKNRTCWFVRHSSRIIQF